MSLISAMGNRVKIEHKILGQDFKVNISKFQNTHTTADITILIIPPTGGTNFLDMSYAKAFSENGMDAIVINRWSEDDEYNLELEIHQRFYSRAQKAIETVLSHITTPQIGILGTSVGAIHASVATSLFTKIQKSFLITGGAPIAEIIAHSEQSLMLEAKEKRFKIHQFKNVKEYIVALDKVISYDPIKLTPNFKGKKLGMSIGLKDTVVPYSNQLQLQKLWNPDMVIEFNNNHFISIVKTWFLKRNDIIKFFKS
ncbi:MAG: hypothetical protein AB7I27_11235 [Bacteriovoracaceae bacterium]